jgi:hypothetical protein
MATEQTAYVGDDVKVLVNVIDSTGSHVAATINTSTTRLNGFSTVPTVNTIGTGIYEVVFASVTPAPAEGDRLIAKINGDISGTAWSEYAVPIKIVADERGTDSVVVPTSDITAIKTKTDQLTFTVANQVDANSLTGGTSPADIYTYFTTGTNEDAFKADTSTLATSAALSGVETKIDTIDTNVDSILVDTGTDIPASIAALNNFDPATDQVIVSTNNDKTGYALSSAANDAIGAAFLAYTLTKGSPGTIERAFWQSLKATQLTDGEVSGTPTASAFDTNLTAVSGAYDHLLILFTSGSLAGEARPIDSYSAINGRITLQEPLTAAPSSADEFIIVPDHSHPVAEIVEGVWSEDQSTYTTSGSFGYYLDAQISGISSGGGDASAANQTTIISHLTDIKGGTFSGSTDSLEAIRDRGDAAWTTGGASGSGLYQVTVSVEDASNNALQGARIAVDGTNLILTTPSNGQVTFNLDSGVYLLTCSPPANYDTPTDVVVSVSTSDVTAEFTLTPTSSASCDVPWIG